MNNHNDVHSKNEDQEYNSKANEQEEVNKEIKEQQDGIENASFEKHDTSFTDSKEENETNPEKEKFSTRNTSGETRQLENDRVERINSNKIRQNKGKGFVTAIAGGVLGVALTFSILPYTDYGKTTTVERSESSHLAEDAVTVHTSSVAVSDLADMVEASSPAIVGIVNIQESQYSSYFYPQQGQPEGNAETTSSGSGVIFKKDENYAYVVTNNHVIENANTLEVSLESGEKTTAEVVGADALSDLAVIKIPVEYATTVLEFGDSTVLRAGETVVAIGNPLGLDLYGTVTQGIISAVDRTVTVETSAGEWDLDVIQTDAAINSGNSGGALLNSAGQVIGINSLKISSSDVEGIGFAIPSEEFIPILNELMENGQVTRVYLGVGLANIEDIPDFYLQNLPESVGSGVMVTNVDSNSAAATAGIEVQDVIVSINDTAVATSTELRKYLYSELKVGDKATIELYRDGKLMSVDVTLTSNTRNVTN